MGAALITPTSLALVIRAFPPPRQVIALGIWAAVSTAALGIGPLVGAAITGSLSFHLPSCLCPVPGIRMPGQRVTRPQSG